MRMRVRTMAAQNTDVPLTWWQKAFVALLLNLMLVLALGGSLLFIGQMLVAEWSGWGVFALQLFKVILASGTSGVLISQRPYNDPLRLWAKRLWGWT